MEFDIDASTPDALKKSLEVSLAKMQGEALSVKDANHEKLGAAVQRLEETVAAAHKSAKEASEKLVAMEKGSARVDTEIDARPFATLSLVHKSDHLNFRDDDGVDSWMRTKFAGKDEATHRDLQLFLNLMVGDRDDFVGFSPEALGMIDRLRVLASDLSVQDALWKAKNPTLYASRGGMQSLAQWPAWVKLTRAIRVAFASTGNADPTAGLGLEWDPAGVAAQTFPDIWPDLGVVAQFPAVSLSRSPMLFAVMNPFVEAYLLDEALDATASGNTAMASRQLTTRNVTLTAKKFGHINWISSEFEEDSIVNVAMASRATGLFALGKAEENASVSGQASAISGTSSSFDTGVTFVSTTNGQDPRRAWDGIRYASSLSGLSQDASAGLTVEHLANLQGQLGRFSRAEQCFLVTGYMGRARLLTLKDAANTAVWSNNGMGGQASAQGQTVPRLFGVSDIVTSYDQGQNLAASGIDDGSAAGKTQIHMVNRLRWAYGVVRLARVEVLRETRGDVDQIGIKFTKRSILKQTVTSSSSDQSLGSVNGIAAS